MAEAATLSVLVVDDERGIRELVKRCLPDSRFRLAEASGGDEALALVSDPKTLDLLITDEMMPGMEGHELSRRLRVGNANLRVLYLTGHSDRLFEAKRQLWHLEAYLDKPFTPDGLREAVAMLMVGRLQF